MASEKFPRAPRDAAAIGKTLEKVFALVTALYWRTHTAHWNLESEDFPSLHEFFATQYEDLWHSLDDIAERFRVVGLPAPSAHPALRGVELGTSRAEILDSLQKGHEEIVDLLLGSIPALEEAGDIAGADYLTGRLAVHEKTAWMLRSTRR